MSVNAQDIEAKNKEADGSVAISLLNFD